MPCILVEVSFIDHPVEGRRLGDRRYRQLAALGLYEGIASYFSKGEAWPKGTEVQTAKRKPAGDTPM
jgi:hypothetical protein